jgi:hypothetical protein
LHPLNIERKKDMERLGFGTGYEFLSWIKQDGATNPVVEHVNLENTDRTTVCKDFEEIRCCVCDFYEIIKDYRRYKWTLHMCDKKDCTGYLCSRCYQKYDQRSSGNKRKSVAKCRNKLLEKSSSIGKGFIGEMIIARTLNFFNCNLELDNFGYCVDLYDPVLYKKIQVKTREPYYGSYTIHFGIEHNFYTLFILCMDKDSKNVTRVYIIPESELYGITTVTIYDKTIRGISKWEKFRVDEKSYNEMYHSMKIENCKVLKDDKAI